MKFKAEIEVQSRNLSSKQTIEVQSINLSSKQNIEVQNINLLKIDTQGYEPEVLQGMGQKLLNVDVVITVSNAHRSPYFNMVKTNHNGFSSLVISSKEKITRRQEVPEVFDMTTVAYVAKPSFVLQNHGIFDGRVRSVYIPPERSLDIDTPLDFKIAE